MDDDWLFEVIRSESLNFRGFPGMSKARIPLWDAICGISLIFESWLEKKHVGIKSVDVGALFFEQFPKTKKVKKVLHTINGFG